MLSIQIVNTGLHPDSPVVGSYVYAVFVNTTRIAEGFVASHVRKDGWKALVAKIIDEMPGDLPGESRRWPTEESGQSTQDTSIKVPGRTGERG